MAITKDLFLSILAMDSYNRGYGAGIDGLGETTGGSRIGGATVSYTLADAKLSEKAQAAGFYAIAYDTPYGTVISYRGTDNGPDYLRGWVMGAGLETAWTQADEALSFYSAVKEKNPTTNTIVTGHSLGGTEGVGFDRTTVGLAA